MYLFAERARERDPAFSLSPHNAHAVAKICQRLEGIPLAIELAAARVGTLSVEQIARRLTDSLKLLTGGARTAVSRLQTLRGTFDWSYELLSAEEKKLFGRLSIFAGGWTLEAAEAVAAVELVEEVKDPDLLWGLVEKSLVVAKRGDEGTVRYRLLEPVRQYALEKLEASGEAEANRRRHAEFFLALAEEAEPKLWGPDQVVWLKRLEVEHDNMRAALSRSIERGEDELAVRLAGALRWFWHGQGHYGEGRRWLEEALSRDSRASVAARAKALSAVGWLAMDQDDTDRVVEAAEEGLKLSAGTEIQDLFGASFMRMLGSVARMRGDYEQASQLYEESLVLSRNAEDRGASRTLSSTWRSCRVIRATTSGRRSSTRKVLRCAESRATRHCSPSTWSAWATSSCSGATTSERRHLTKKPRRCSESKGTRVVWSLPSTTWDGQRCCVRITNARGRHSKRASSCA